jgi:hypothetical protein
MHMALTMLALASAEDPHAKQFDMPQNLNASV